MTLYDYIRELDQPGTKHEASLEAYAKRVGTSAGYLRLHVLKARKAASLRYMRKLAEASEGRVTLTDVLKHYGVTEQELNNNKAA